MAGTAIMWFRRDLRVRDLPALAAAAKADRIVPVFVFDDRLMTAGRFPSAVRTDFMLGCLRALDAALRERGGRLVVRRGESVTQIARLAAETGADELHFTADASPFARRRDQAVIDRLAAAGVTAFAHPGAYIVDDPAKVVTKDGRPYTVFTPFRKAWLAASRRGRVQAPASLKVAPKVQSDGLPSLKRLGFELPTDYGNVFEPGEEAGRRVAGAFARDGLDSYAARRNDPAGGSSRLSPYLRWGCISPLALDRRAAEAGADTFRSELAWREFYAAVLMSFPHVAKLEFQERYRSLEWDHDEEELDAWKRGMTGFPLVDAGLRQLLHEGWMHNRVRIVVASFLTKDLHIDWRAGEAHFMERLIDGDVASNNGGWQWVASTGTDPKPYFQRMFNPTTQQKKFDPDGEYVRRWVPELERVPDDLLPEPWEMTGEQQSAAGCEIGADYPAPIVDHAEERRRAIERYRAVAR